MVKKAAISAIWVSIGVTLGGVFLPCIFNFGAQWNNDTYPPIWRQVVLYFVVAYFASFAVYLLIEWLKSHRK